MPNDYFEFKQFKVKQSGCAQKVSTDACLFGAWTARHCSPENNVLDIGAGTGLLMLMIAQKHDVDIEGIEIEETCFARMQQNLESSPWRNRLRVLHADVRTFLFEKKYDLVIANPPFYEKQLQSADAGKNIAWHSSELSLAELTAIASGVLSKQGRFSVIIPFSRKQEVLTEAAQHELFAERILTVRHTLQHAQTRCMVIFSKNQVQTVETELMIREENGSYSQDFTALLADYYLYL